MQPLTLALAQTGDTPDDVGESVRQHVALVRRAHEGGARVVVFPELSLTGYDLGRARERPDTWFTTDDERLTPLRDASAATGVTAVVGAAVREGGRRLLAGLRVEPDGRVAAHGKTHLHSGEHELFDPVEPGAPVVVAGWSVGFGVCYDLAHPGHAAALADAGAELYLAGVVYDQGDDRRFDVHGAARAMDHRLVVAAANGTGARPGARSCGLSSVWGPDGTVRARAGREPELLLATVDRDEVLRLRERDRAARDAGARLDPGTDPRRRADRTSAPA